MMDMLYMNVSMHYYNSDFISETGKANFEIRFTD